MQCDRITSCQTNRGKWNDYQLAAPWNSTTRNVCTGPTTKLIGQSRSLTRCLLRVQSSCYRFFLAISDKARRRNHRTQRVLLYRLRENINKRAKFRNFSSSASCDFSSLQKNRNFEVSQFWNQRYFLKQRIKYRNVILFRYLPIVAFYFKRNTLINANLSNFIERNRPKSKG